MSLPTFTFDIYTLRPATADDFPLAAVWTRADPDHHRKIAPEFWCDGRDSYLLIDPEGPVFFFKTERARNREIKLYIQFQPCETTACRARTIAGLMAGLQWLEKMLVALGYETVYFTSKRQPLILFCTRRLGFAFDGTMLRKSLGSVSDGGKEMDTKGDGQDGEEGHRGQVRQSHREEDRQRQA